ncbi:MAG: lipopolysaccharide core heptose(I) kinase RfaP, partial [Gammaproteobacteria bacterium]|nr:lipopolysaccharide core heptose(I) kinase RfaP [Gammaproteobacteria bacterium]
WEGQKPQDVRVELVPAAGISNHSRANSFHRHLQQILCKQHFDAVVGFNKMPGLDVYYAADDCYVARAKRFRNPIYRWTPRYRCLAAFEKSVFDHDTNTQILLITERERAEFQEYYAIPDHRFHVLPPTLDYARRIPQRVPELRDVLRRELRLAEHDRMVLLVGSGFRTKGLDRAIRALVALPATLRDRTHLFVVGQGKQGPFARLALRHRVADHVHFLGGRQDVPQLLNAGDVLIHPAYNEAAGTILLEAITAGLPVLTTDVCGYSPHVQAAEAGVVLSSPFRQDALNHELKRMLTSDEQKTWSRNGLAYGTDPSLYAMPEAATNIIEQHVNHPPRAQDRAGYSSREGTVVYLRDDLRKVLNGHCRFEDVMTIQGQVFRKAPGRHTLRFSTNGHRYFLKAHTGVGWREILKNLSYFRRPVLGADNEWHGIHRLQRLGVNTMRVAGYGTTGNNPARRRSFIITDELRTTMSLEEFCVRWQQRRVNGPVEVRFKRWLIRNLAEIARTIHANGANHRDFYLCHFLIDANNLPTDPEVEACNVYLIDLHRMQLRRKTPVRWLVKDIAGLYYSSMDINLTSRDLFRFMKVYRRKPLREILKTEKRFWGRVISRAHNLYVAEQRKAERSKVSTTETPMAGRLG